MRHIDVACWYRHRIFCGLCVFGTPVSPGKIADQLRWESDCFETKEPCVRYGSTLALTVKYNRTVYAWWQCGLKSYYFDHFFSCLSQQTRTHPFNSPFSGTTQVSRYQKGKTNLDFTEARDSEWQWHPLGHMHVCTSLQTDNHASTPPLSFLQAGCPSCRPTNSVKALKAHCRNTWPVTHEHDLKLVQMR